MREFLARDGVRRTLRTFGYSFLGVLLPGLLGWLNDLTQWARDEGQAPFPDARSLAYLGVSAIVAGFIALVNGIGILLENLSGHAVLRNPPAPAPRPDRGAISLYGLLALVILIIVLAVVFGLV